MENFKRDMNQADQPAPELQEVPVTPELDRSPKIPPGLINELPDDFLDEQGRIDRERDQEKIPPHTLH